MTCYVSSGTLNSTSPNPNSDSYKWASDSLDVVAMSVSPPQPVSDVVDGESVRPTKLRVDYDHSHTAVHASTTDAWRVAPVAPEQIPDEKKHSFRS